MTTLVTGGGGFLGGSIVRQLLARGDTVRSFARGTYPDLAKLGVEICQGDLGDAEAVSEAVRGCRRVFHVAAKAGVWGPPASYHHPNVLGTENILAACRRHGVRHLIFTSSPSVTFAGHDEAGIDESAPYPARYLCAYPETKARAEQAVLAANDASLQTVALRPHLIWGPGDTQLVPRIVARARAGRLRIVGSGQNRVDSVYIDNAADAHLLAADELAGEGKCAGKPYFITNGEPLPMAVLLNRILEAAGDPPVTRQISARAAYALGAALEVLYGLLGREAEPPMTRFVARQLAAAHWYDIGAAQRDFGYLPTVSIDEGMERLARDLRAGAM
jgi:nucleoside-diphosphate-sugar epimerase